MTTLNVSTYTSKFGTRSKAARRKDRRERLLAATLPTPTTAAKAKAQDAAFTPRLHLSLARYAEYRRGRNAKRKTA